MKERRPFDSDIDERCLHPGKYSGDATFVYIAHETAATRALYQHLLKHTVLQQHGAYLRRSYIDEDFLPHEPFLFPCSHSGIPSSARSAAVRPSGKPITAE